MPSRKTGGTGLVIALVAISAVAAQDNPFTMHAPPPVVGRWDVTVGAAGEQYPSWFEVWQSGYRTLVGTYVGQFGSARPLGKVEYDDGRVQFAVPPQWEQRTDDQVLEGTLHGDVIRGETTNDSGDRIEWIAHRAPSLDRSEPVQWGEPIELFNGHDLAGWKPRFAGARNGWAAKDGVLANVQPGNDLLTEQQFTDFKLQTELRYPQGSNSGIYLRGRYEVQIEDDYGQEPDSHRIGGVYGFLTPCVNAARQANEWQTLEITLVGRAITVVLNGERILDRQAIPGITGGALDSDEGEPGPILLQGDHGPIEFRRMTLTPGVSGP